MTDSNAPELGAEDSKLVTLARASRARTGAAEGAAVRDETGRTYTAVTVDLPHLRLTALQAAVAAAVSSEAASLEAAAVVTAEEEPREEDREAAADLKTAVLITAAPDGTPTSLART